MLPLEAWQKIFKTLGDKKKEIKTFATLCDPARAVLTWTERDTVLFSGVPNRIGGEALNEEVAIDYEEFEKVFPIYFKKDRFDEKYKAIAKNQKYIFSVIKEFALAKDEVDFSATTENDNSKAENVNNVSGNLARRSL